MSRSDIRRVMKAAIKRGWKDVSHEKPRSGHYMLRHPNGAQVMAPYSPSCGRAHKNLEAELRRVEKGIDPRSRKPYSRGK